MFAEENAQRDFYRKCLYQLNTVFREPSTGLIAVLTMFPTSPEITAIAQVSHTSFRCIHPAAQYSWWLQVHTTISGALHNAVRFEHLTHTFGHLISPFPILWDHHSNFRSHCSLPSLCWSAGWVIGCAHWDLRYTLVKSVVWRWTDKLDNVNAFSMGQIMTNTGSLSQQRVSSVSTALIHTALTEMYYIWDQCTLADLFTIQK